MEKRGPRPWRPQGSPLRCNKCGLDSGWGLRSARKCLVSVARN